MADVVQSKRRANADTRPSLPTTSSLTQGLIVLIRRRPIVEDDYKGMALFTLDAIANAIAGSTTEPGRILAAWGRANGGDAGRCALVAGGSTHILEVDDLHRASVVHTGCTVVPAALAMAEPGRTPGRKLLKAILHGYDAAARVGMAVGPGHYKVWHNTGTCGPFGAAMAAAELLDLEEAQTVHALGNAGTQSAGLWQFLATGAMSKHLHAGRAAEAGCVAAGLARLGFTGPPAILEGATGLFAGACPDPDPDAVLRDPEAPWQVHLTSIKPWPSCRHTHSPIDAALELAQKVEPDAISEVVVSTYQAALDVCDRPGPESLYEAKFSLQHCAAIALLHGKVVFNSFDEVSRTEAAALATKTRLAVAEPYDSAYPEAWGASVELILKSGESVTASRETCRGDPEAALTSDEMVEKARMLLNYGGVEEPSAIIDPVLAMADDAPVPRLPAPYG